MMRFHALDLIYAWRSQPMQQFNNRILGKPPSRPAKPVLKLLRSKPEAFEHYLSVVKDGVGGAALAALVHVLVLFCNSPARSDLLASSKVRALAARRGGDSADDSNVCEQCRVLLE